MSTVIDPDFLAAAIEREHADIEVGTQIRFDGAKGRWWTVQARDDRFIVATVRPPFSNVNGDMWYTVIDLTGWVEKRYNGAGHGVVRSSLNTLGGGWHISPDNPGPDCRKILMELQAGRWELSHRRVTNARDIERKRS